jgi:hypothetical protein
MLSDAEKLNKILKKLKEIQDLAEKINMPISLTVQLGDWVNLIREKPEKEEFFFADPEIRKEYLALRDRSKALQAKSMIEKREKEG